MTTSAGRALLAALLCALALAAQYPFRWTHTGGYSVTGTSAKVTLQVPSGATRTVHPLEAFVQCASLCTVTVTQGGTAATATAATPVKGRTANPAAAAEFYTASDSTGGTSYTPPIDLVDRVLDLTDIELLPGERLSVSVSSGSSQKITVFMKWEEY